MFGHLRQILCFLYCVYLLGGAPLRSSSLYFILYLFYETCDCSSLERSLSSVPIPEWSVIPPFDVLICMIILDISIQFSERAKGFSLSLSHTASLF